MIKIAASTLAADSSKLEEEFNRVEEAGVDLLHLDVMDGKFVPNNALGFEEIEAVRKNTELPFDIHLMIAEPEKNIERYLEFSPHYLSFHLEATSNAEELIELIKGKEVKVGVAVNAPSNIEEVFPFLGELDFVLVMSVNAGFSGQKFLENSVKKISELRKKIDEENLKVEIEVDGGINEENVKKVIDAGANIIVSGSTIFNSKDLKETINKLRGK
ncbi:MAG: ribulose-phosphate 3-epimerase [archaeon]